MYTYKELKYYERKIKMDLVESNNKNNRIYYLDILRVMACLAVIMIHTSMTYVIKDIGSVNFG